MAPRCTDLSNPVRVEDAEVARDLAAYALLGHRSQASLELEFVNTFSSRLTVANTCHERNSVSVNHSDGAWRADGRRTLGHRPLAVTPLDADTVDHVALLGLVAEATGLVRPSRARRAVDRGQLAVLPRADTEQEPEHIALLPLVKLFEILQHAAWRRETSTMSSTKCIV